MHSVARAQLSRLGLEPDSAPTVPPWRAFLEEVSRKYARDDAIQECIEEGIAVIDAGELVFVNERFRELWGVPHVDVGMTADEAALWMATRLSDPVAYLAAFRASLGAEGAERGDVTLSDGRVLECCSAAVRDGAAAVVGRVWSYRDVTEERRLAVARRVVTARMASVSRIVGEVAHVINNPLAGVAGNVEHVHGLTRESIEVDGPLDRAEILEALDDARAGIERISTFIRDLRVLAGVDDEPRAPMDANVAVDAALAVVRPRHEGRVRWCAGRGAVAAVLANESRLAQILVNVLEHAAEGAGDAGGETKVTITTATTADGDLRIDVVDDGHGVAAEEIDRIFDPFVTRRAGSGAGLGLSVAKTVVEWLGGRIRVDAPPEGGSRVTIVLPGHRATPA